MLLVSLVTFNSTYVFRKFLYNDWLELELQRYDWLTSHWG